MSQKRDTNLILEYSAAIPNDVSEEHLMTSEKYFGILSLKSDFNKQYFIYITPYTHSHRRNRRLTLTGVRS